MGERKVYGHYFPPDFDPAKVPRQRQPKNRQMKVRTMLHATVRCSACGHYIYRGTKFNAMKEAVEGETYLGFQILRFKLSCTNCSAEISYVTDPKNSGYIIEAGATHNYENWVSEEVKTRKVDDFAVLDELKSMKSRRAVISDSVLEALEQRNGLKGRSLEEEADEAVIKSVFGERDKAVVRRINDDEELNRFSHGPSAKRSKANEESDSIFKSSSIKVALVVKKPSVDFDANKPSMEDRSSTGLRSLLVQYGSEDED